jgi:hypothetical protein
MATNETSEQRRWRLILDDVESSSDLQNEARKHLGLAIEAKPIRYTADLDEPVQSYWGVGKSELEDRHPIAETVYFVLVRCCLMGGCFGQASADAEILLSVLATARSPWMRTRISRSLLTLKALHPTELSPDQLTRINAALELIHDSDDEEDWLGLVEKYARPS